MPSTVFHHGCTLCWFSESQRLDRRALWMPSTVVHHKCAVCWFSESQRLDRRASWMPSTAIVWFHCMVFRSVVQWLYLIHCDCATNGPSKDRLATVGLNGKRGLISHQRAVSDRGGMAFKAELSGDQRVVWRPRSDRGRNHNEPYGDSNQIEVRASVGASAARDERAGRRPERSRLRLHIGAQPRTTLWCAPA